MKLAFLMILALLTTPVLSQTPLQDSLKTLSNKWVQVDTVQKTVTINKAGVVAIGNELRKGDSLAVQIVEVVESVNDKVEEIEIHKKEAGSLRDVITTLQLKNNEQENQNVLNLHDQELVIAGLTVDLKKQVGKKWTWATLALLIGTAFGFVIGL